jgi:diaminohydroxyphosphoribosylaminopyrimidine deaminase/5-amino-6-(5-phosphoribosylamino)uracil reductase
VRVKLAMSLDGRTAMANGESKWITGEAARADVQAYRARASAILTGLGTVLADDPRLTARVPEGVDCVAPMRVVLDHHGALPRACHLLDGEAPTLVAHADDIVPDYGPTVEGFAVPRRDGHLDLLAVLAQLATRQVNEVQVEAGATLAGAFLRAGLVDELVIYVAPVLLGDRGRPLFAGLGIERMEERLGLERLDLHAFDDGDLRLTYRPAR